MQAVIKIITSKLTFLCFTSEKSNLTFTFFLELQSSGFCRLSLYGQLKHSLKYLILCSTNEKILNCQVFNCCYSCSCCTKVPHVSDLSTKKKRRVHQTNLCITRACVGGAWKLCEEHRLSRLLSPVQTKERAVTK